MHGNAVYITVLKKHKNEEGRHCSLLLSYFFYRLVNRNTYVLFQPVAEDFYILGILFHYFVSAFTEIRPDRSIRFLCNFLNGGEGGRFSAFLNLCYKGCRNSDSLRQLTLRDTHPLPSFLQVTAKDFL